MKRWTSITATLFLSIYYIWFFVPYIRVTFNSNVHKYLFFSCFIIGIGILFFFNYLVNFKEKLTKAKLTFNILIPIVIYMLVMTGFVLFDYYDASNHIRVSFTFWGTALVYYLMSDDPSLQRSFGKLLIALLIINSITSFIGVYSDPSAARALTNADKTPQALEEDIFLSRKNISSIYLFQSLAVMAPIFVYMIKKKINIILASLALLFIILAVLKASFTICFLLLIAGIVLSVLYVKGPAGRIILTIFVILLLFLPWGSIFGRLSVVVNNPYISQRLYAMSRFLSEGIMEKGVSGRIEAYLSSFQTFIKNPLGIGAHYSYKMFENGIGYHSQILDDLARYGIFALAFYIAFLSQYYKLLKKQWSKINMEEAVFPLFIVYVGFLMLNIAFRSSAESVVVLFILPVLPDIILYKRCNATEVHNIG
jgi:hypothetical protein